MGHLPAITFSYPSPPILLFSNGPPFRVFLFLDPTKEKEYDVCVSLNLMISRSVHFPEHTLKNVTSHFSME